MPFSSSVHDAKVRGTRAYFSWYTNGVLVADISRPARPRLLARFLPRPSADPEGSICDAGPCRQVWGVALSGESVLASDMVSGLWIFRVR